MPIRFELWARLAASGGIGILLATFAASSALATESKKTGFVTTLCTAGRASKERLALWYLKNAGLDALFLETWRESEDARLAKLPQEERRRGLNGLSDAQRLIASEEDPANISESESKALASARNSLSDFLTDTNAVDVVTKAKKYNALEYDEKYTLVGGKTSRQDFFLDAAAYEQCVTGTIDAAKVVPDDAKNDSKFDLPFRIRGSTDGLYITKANDGYKGVEKATLSVDYDAPQKQRKDKTILVIGRSLLPEKAKDNPSFNRFDAILYYGIDRELTKTKGSVAKQTADTWDAGVSLSTYFVAPVYGWETGNRIVARPDYLFDRIDHSSIESLNISYIPYVHGIVNSAIDIWGKSAKLTPSLDLRLDNGWYAGRGRTGQSDHKDFNRIGTRFGFDLASTVPWLPLEFQAAETHLHTLRGKPDSIDDFTSKLSWSLDSIPAISFDLSYENGRREDTAKTVHTWGIGLSAKY